MAGIPTARDNIKKAKAANAIAKKGIAKNGPTNGIHTNNAPVIIPNAIIPIDITKKIIINPIIELATGLKEYITVKILYNDVVLIPKVLFKIFFICKNGLVASVEKLSILLAIPPIPFDVVFLKLVNKFLLDSYNLLYYAKLLLYGICTFYEK